jgi:hypothetical protein
MWHAWVRRGKCTRFWCEGPKESDLSEDRGVDGRIRMDLMEIGREGGMDSVGSGQEPVADLVNAVISRRVLAPRISFVLL